MTFYRKAIRDIVKFKDKDLYRLCEMSQDGELRKELHKRIAKMEEK